jgi:hypothetical protein
MIVDVEESRNLDVVLAVAPPNLHSLQGVVCELATCRWGLVIFVIAGVCTVLMFVFFIVLVVRVLT